MINNFPFYPQPYSNYYLGYPQNIYKNAHNQKNYKEKYSNQKKQDNHQKNKQFQNLNKMQDNLYNHKEVKKLDKSTSNKSNIFENLFFNNNDTPMFELFGIKLYQDDILLICLIFFLYNEGIKDEFLFIALLLLLLS